MADAQAAGLGPQHAHNNPLPPDLPNTTNQLLNVSFGVRGTRNAASWIVAGGLAYYLIWVPESKRRQEIEVRDHDSAGGLDWMVQCLK